MTVPDVDEVFESETAMSLVNKLRVTFISFQIIGSYPEVPRGGGEVEREECLYRGGGEMERWSTEWLDVDSNSRAGAVQGEVERAAVGTLAREAPPKAVRSSLGGGIREKGDVQGNDESTGTSSPPCCGIVARRHRSRAPPPLPALPKKLTFPNLRWKGTAAESHRRPPSTTTTTRSHRGLPPR